VQSAEARAAYKAQYYKKHRAEILAYQQQHYRAGYCARQRQLATLRSAEIGTYMRQYRQEHKAEAAAASRKFLKEHPDKVAAYSRKSYAAHQTTRNHHVRQRRAQNLPQFLARERAYHAAHRDEAMVRVRKRLYGIDREQFDALVRKARNGCQICGRRFRKAPRLGPHTDHDHVTGKVRGVLCGYCNRMLGNALDSPRILRRGAAYLEKTKHKSSRKKRSSNESPIPKAV
jgi:hypothetical protein